MRRCDNDNMLRHSLISRLPINWIVSGGITLVTLAIGLALLTKDEGKPALVMVTPQDCLRAFNAETCTALVEAALDVHYKHAPRFMSEEQCQLSYRDDPCMRVEAFTNGPATYVPPLVAIVTTREGTRDTKLLLPVYEKPGQSADLATKAASVYFSGKHVGHLTRVRFGGAGISRLTTASGTSVTEDDISNLRLRKR
jgi:uncharacterized protein YgiB involved in biofilm formation